MTLSRNYDSSPSCSLSLPNCLPPTLTAQVCLRPISSKLRNKTYFCPSVFFCTCVALNSNEQQWHQMGLGPRERRRDESLFR
jgi:hypothetical protein